MYKNIVLLGAVMLIAASCNVNPNPYADAKATLAGRALNLDIVKTQTDRSIGLGGRAPLNDGQGMLFQFDYSDKHVFWMKGMNFDIDIIWLQDNKVVYIMKNVKAQPGAPDEQLTKYKPEALGNSVLEVRSGWADYYHVKLGDTLELK